MLGVLDEVELLPIVIGHLRTIGVAGIIAFDRGSRDGSREVLEDLRDGHGLWVVDVHPESALDAGVTSAEELALARRMEADWVIFLDADEFWVPSSGSLLGCAFVRDADVAIVDRYNVPLAHQGVLAPPQIVPSQFDHLLLHVRAVDGLRDAVNGERAVAWSSGVPMPKVAARPDKIIRVRAGHHEPEPADMARVAPRPIPDVLIAHMPFTTWTRFERKVRNIRETMRIHPDFFAGDQAWHWRRWRDLLEAGRLEHEYARQIVEPPALAELRRAGAIKSAREIFTERRRAVDQDRARGE